MFLKHYYDIMAKKTKGKGKDEKIERFLKNLPITPCLKKCEPMFCFVCKERNWEVAQYCPHAASEIYGDTPIHKEVSAKKPEEEEVVKFKPMPKTLLGIKPKPEPSALKREEEVVKFKPIPKPSSFYKLKKPSPPIFKRKEKRKPEVLPGKRYAPKLEEGFFTKKFKMVAGIIIVIAIILQSISLISMSGGEDIKAPDADYSIRNELYDVINEVSTRSSDGEIAQDVDNLYNNLDWNVYSVQKENIGYTLNPMPAESVESLKIFNHASLTDFLTTRGLDDFFGVATNRFRRYYVFTYYQGYERTDEDGLVGTELLAQKNSLGSFIGSYGDLRTSEWNPVDVDGGGDDINVRINPNTTGMPSKGGIDIEIQRINDKSPIDIYFVKPSSYDNETYIWVVGFHFSNLPSNFRFTALSEDIIEVTKGGLIGGYVETINPPYVVDWYMDENVAEFKTIVGYANITWWTDYMWYRLPFTGEGEDVPPRNLSWSQPPFKGSQIGDEPNTVWSDDFSGGNLSEEPYFETTWFHTTSEDFENNRSSKDNVVFDNNEISLDNKVQDGEFISKALDPGGYAVLKSVTWTTDTPLRTSVFVKGSENAVFWPADAALTEVIHGTSFQYKIKLLSGGSTNLKDITLTVAKGGARVTTADGALKLSTFTTNIGGQSINFYYPRGTFTSRVWCGDGYVTLDNVTVSGVTPSGTSYRVWVAASWDGDSWVEKPILYCDNTTGTLSVDYDLIPLEGMFFKYKIVLTTKRPVVTTGATPEIYSITLRFNKIIANRVEVSDTSIKLAKRDVPYFNEYYYYLRGTYISEVYDTNSWVVLSDANVTVDVPNGTFLSVWVETSGDNEDWPSINDFWYMVYPYNNTIGRLNGRYFRYRVELTTTKPRVATGGVTPTFYGITLNFSDSGGKRIDTSGNKIKLEKFTINITDPPRSYYYPHGVFYSQVYNLSYIVKFENIEVTYHFEDPNGNSVGHLPGATIEVFLRTSVNNTTWDNFVPVWSSINYLSGQSVPIYDILKDYLINKGMYVQYKLILTALPRRTPVITEIKIQYSMNFGNLAEKCWANITFTPAPKSAKIYYDDTDTTQILNWKIERKTNLSCSYISGEKLCAEINISSAPTNLNILTEDFGAYSRTTYSANDGIPRLTYSCWELDVNRKTYLVLENIPTSFTVESTFKLPPETQNEIEPKESAITTVLDYVVMQVTAPFSRIETALRSITQTILSENNDFYLSADDYMNVEFGVINNNQYITVDGNFIAFLDSSISARILEIKKMRTTSQSNLEMITRGNRPLRILCVEGNDETAIRISNLPENLNISLSQDISYYTNTAVESVEVIHNGENYLYANLSNISGFGMIRTAAGSQLNLNGNVDARVIMSGGIGVPQILNESYGDYLLFDQTQDSLSAALMMKNLQSISFGSEISVNFSSEKPLRLVYSNNSGFHGRMLIKDMPKTLTFTLGDFSVSLPEIYNPSLANMPNIISAFISPIDQMTLMIDSITQKFVGFSTEFDLSYEFSNSTTFIGNITQGALPDTDIKWTHGISLFREDDDISGKIYMTLPKKGDISLTEEDERIRVAFKFENYYPDYDWLLINITGDKEALIYMENITSQKINATIDVMPNLALPELHQYIDFSASNDLGNFYLRAKKEGSTIEMFLSDVPLQVTASSVISNNSIIINYTSTKTADYLFLNLTKECDGLRSMNVLIQEIPKTVNLKIERDIHIDPEKLSFGKMLPAINMSADSPAEIHIFLKRPETLTILQRAEEITIEGSVDQLFFALRDCSLSEDYKINELKIYAENINTVYVKFHFLFGKVPITELKSDGTVRVNIDYEFEVVGGGIKRSMVLCNVALLSLKIQENSIAISDSNTHYIIPAPMLSLGNWWIGIVVIVGIMGAWGILLYKRIRQNK